MSQRRLSCENCGHVWKVPAEPVERVRCPMCEIPVCACGCGADLGDMRIDSRFISRAHAVAFKRANGGESPAASTHRSRTRDIAEVRAEQEEAKGHWSMVVREGIIEALRINPDGFHADDLEPLGIPDEHKNVVGSQIAKLVNQRFIQECGRRKSVVASRNGAKSNVYRMTALGWKKLAGFGGEGDSTLVGDRGPGPDSSEPGECGAGEPVESRDPLPSGSAPPDSAAAPPTPLFGAGPSAYDQMSDAA